MLHHGAGLGSEQALNICRSICTLQKVIFNKIYLRKLSTGMRKLLFQCSFLASTASSESGSLPLTTTTYISTYLVRHINMHLNDSFGTSCIL